MVRLLYPRDCRYRALLSTHLFVVSTHIDTLTLRLSSFAFTLIMISPCFITPTVVVLLEVIKPDVPNDFYWYVWRGNEKRYGVPRRNKHRRDNNYYFYNVLHELLRKSMMMMRLHVCCAECIKMMKSIFIIVQ